MVMNDTLTGCLNRRGFDHALNQAVIRALRRGGELALLAIDIDHFKVINDTAGHLAGDAVLRELAGLLSHTSRGGDVVGRVGGEEFVVVMPETDLAVATMVAERLRRRIASEQFPIQQGVRSIEVTISIGIAALGSADNAATVLKRADQALYRAKRDGRNRVVPDAA